MVRLAVIASLLALVACSAQESGQTGDTGDATPPVSAESNIPALEVEIDEAIVIEAVAPEVTSCLSLIRQGEFPQAAAGAADAAAGDAAGGIRDAAGLTQ